MKILHRKRQQNYYNLNVQTQSHNDDDDDDGDDGYSGTAAATRHSNCLGDGRVGGHCIPQREEILQCTDNVLHNPVKIPINKIMWTKQPSYHQVT